MKGPRGPKDYLALARDAETSAEWLDQLARSEYSFVRTAVASHPTTTADTLRSLVPDGVDQSPDHWLLKALAWHPNSDVGTLRRIAELIRGHLNSGRGNQELFGAGIALFSRFDTPVDILHSLLEDPGTSKSFRKVIARQSGRADILDLLRVDSSEIVRRAAQGNVDTQA